MTSDYDVAQICLNGHVINAYAKTHPEHNEKYCSKCGKETIMRCPSCYKDIRGNYHIPEVYLPEYEIPKWCYECGKPYPWTLEKLQAAKELTNEIENLTDDEKELLKTSLEDIVSDNPRTQLGAICG